MSDEPKLLPCPFCGSEVIGMEQYGHGNSFYACTCLECGAKVDDLFTTPQEAVEAWNKRVEIKENK